MNVLVLGGTRFLGRHIVATLAERGHRVVCFHRGSTRCALPSAVEERFGDRNADLSAVDTERWDAIVDVNALEPEQVERSLRLRADRYVFVSTVSVYADFSVAGIAEDAATIETFDPADAAVAYGGKKAACERLVRQRYPQNAAILRPGLIAGRWDYTGRFTYWCERLMRGGSVLVPAPADRRVQFVDAADIARFAETVVTRKVFGVFNLVGPARPTSMPQLLREAAFVARELGAPPSRLSWIDGALLTERGVEPWTEMPLWAPGDEWSGLLEISNAAALAAGLELRPIAETVRAVLDWTQAEHPPNPAGLDAGREAELLSLS
ncbi:MAG TPA: NAD-dependent epimerase/dehydratase family protein [Candidatus Cybelea sp.]